MPRFEDTIYSYTLDYGGMFDGEAGVRKIDDKYYAYVADGWGRGRQGPAKPSLAIAKKDIERLIELEFD